MRQIFVSSRGMTTTDVDSFFCTAIAS